MGCFLFTTTQNNSLIRTIENGFGGKGGDVIPGKTNPKEHPTMKTHLSVHSAKDHTAQGKLRMR